MAAWAAVCVKAVPTPIARHKTAEPIRNLIFKSLARVVQFVRAVYRVLPKRLPRPHAHGVMLREFRGRSKRFDNPVSRERHKTNVRAAPSRVLNRSALMAALGAFGATSQFSVIVNRTSVTGTPARVHSATKVPRATKGDDYDAEKVSCACRNLSPRYGHDHDRR